MVVDDDLVESNIKKVVTSGVDRPIRGMHNKDLRISITSGDGGIRKSSFMSKRGIIVEGAMIVEIPG